MFILLLMSSRQCSKWKIIKQTVLPIADEDVAVKIIWSQSIKANILIIIQHSHFYDLGQYLSDFFKSFT